MQLVTADTPFLTLEPQAAPEQCARFILSRPHGEYTDYDVRNVIVPAYFALCGLVGVNPVLPIAQMIQETGNMTSWWAQRPRRNPAGIGVTGRKQPASPGGGAWQWDAREGIWREGIAFPTWKDDAIPAHIGRILAYALPDSKVTPRQQELIRLALSYRPLPLRYRGAAPTLRGLNGRWAVPGNGYADRIAALANAIRGV